MLFNIYAMLFNNRKQKMYKNEQKNGGYCNHATMIFFVTPFT